MTPADRKALAEQLLNNPLFGETFDRLEKDATEAMIFADDETERMRLGYRVREIRNFRHDCNAALRANIPE
jgi:hypothetical protein